MEPHLLIVDDQASILKFLRKSLEIEGYSVRTAANGLAALQAIEEEIPDLVLLDLMLPDLSGLEVLDRLKAQFPRLCVVMMTAFADVPTAVTAMRAGAYDYITKPFNLEQLLTVLERGVDSSRNARELYTLRRRNDLFRGNGDIVPSRAANMQAVYETVNKVAVGEATTVLIEGESGVGKDVVANLIHSSSARRDEPFLEVNCAAVPEKLLESELFGHEKGAFTDAVNQKSGLLELAHKGTLFLDEIGEMSIPLQVKLLRILEKQTFRRVGGEKDISVDVRIISATNRDLATMVADGRFREDLYYRLKVVPLYLPPLRERVEDILPLAEHFLRHFCKRFSKGFRRFTASGEAALTAHDWPGNIRELRNVLERACLLEDGEELDAVQMGLDAPGGIRPVAGPAGSLGSDLAAAVTEPFPEDGVDLEALVQGFERAMVNKALDAAGRNRTRAARLLRLNRDKLRYRMKTYDLD